MLKALASAALGIVVASSTATGGSAQATSNSVRQKRVLTCGSNGGFRGFGMPDAQGNRAGFDLADYFHINCTKYAVVEGMIRSAAIAIHRTRYLFT